MKYRKKPVVVEAEVYSGEFPDVMTRVDGWIVKIAGPELPHEIKFEDVSEAYMFYECGDCGTFSTDRKRQKPIPFINTLEGPHEVSPGDYIITGVKGERYPCKPDIFHMTYEPVE
ncbi:hypothetical protein [Sporomusa aerivorans]|uniref:hypothetical protein n=1 Tax=Sporomusa aerivorans TaxID=204936 RepID=UPI00352A4640